MPFRGIALILTLFLILSSVSTSALAQAGAPVTVLESEAQHTFGEQITFRASLQNADSVQLVEILFRPRDATKTLARTADLQEGQVSYTFFVLQEPMYFPVFSVVEYRFRFTLQNKEIVYSEWFSFTYDDNRFVWNSLEEPPFTAYWVDGDITLGQSVLDAARVGLKKIQGVVDLPNPDHLKIYVYPSSNDVESALQMSGMNLIAGHASPELGVMLVSLPAGITQKLEIQRQVPHELLHILLYERYSSAYEHIPVWLSEGLATLSQASSDPDYDFLLKDADQRQALLSMESLCRSFRTDGSLFTLSYAQSEAFTRYLYDNYGASNLEELLRLYSEGVECVRAPELVYGQSLTRLDERWRRSLGGEESAWAWVQPLVPWLVLMGIVLFVPLLLTFSGLARSRSTLARRGAPH
jgi:hypothetical protein